MHPTMRPVRVGPFNRGRGLVIGLGWLIGALSGLITTLLAMLIGDLAFGRAAVLALVVGVVQVPVVAGVLWLAGHPSRRGNREG